MLRFETKSHADGLRATDGTDNCEAIPGEGSMVTRKGGKEMESTFGAVRPTSGHEDEIRMALG